MWHCITGKLVPNISKVHSTSIFRVNQSLKHTQSNLSCTDYSWIWRWQNPSQHVNSSPNNTMWQPEDLNPNQHKCEYFKNQNMVQLGTIQSMDDVSSIRVGKNAHACPLQHCLQFSHMGKFWQRTNRLLLIARTRFKWN